MSTTKLRQRLLAVGLLGAGLIVPTLIDGVQADETFKTLKENIFVCVSPQAYDEAMLRVGQLNGKDLAPLKQELSEQKQCMFVDPELADGIMPPFAVVLQREGTKVQVQFVVTLRERKAFLHRLINRYVLVGWTDESNLQPKVVL
jgi:hypothetical protein